MSRMTAILGIIFVSALFNILSINGCRLVDLNKKNGSPISRYNCISANLMAAHFIDGSGTYQNAIYDATTIMTTYDNRYCNGYRFIIAGVSYEYAPWPKNVTTCDTMIFVQPWLESTVQPYRGIFDLQDSVNTFLQHPSFSSYDPQSNRPPWAVIYAYSDTVGGMNNLLNGISRLTSEGYTVLLLTSQLTRHKTPQLLQVLPQSNIMSANFGLGDSSTWLPSRFDAGYTVPITNQTGTSGYITSPNYPNNYTRYNLHEYYITAPSTSYTIILTINEFVLDPYSSTVLYVYQGSNMNDDDNSYVWRGNMPVQDFTIQSNAATLRFISDFIDSSRGFNISWTAIHDPSKEVPEDLIK